MDMNPERCPKSSSSRTIPSWRQRIDDALSSLKVAPPDGGLREHHGFGDSNDSTSSERARH